MIDVSQNVIRRDVGYRFARFWIYASLVNAFLDNKASDKAKTKAICVKVLEVAVKRGFATPEYLESL